MITPNVAVAFPQTARDAITTKLNDAKLLFPVLATVANEDRKKLQVIAEGREPYVAGAAADAQANPGTVPGTVNVAEWLLLEEQHAGLFQMESLLLGLLEFVQDTKALVGSQRYDKARRYYNGSSPFTGMAECAVRPLFHAGGTAFWQFFSSGYRGLRVR